VCSLLLDAFVRTTVVAAYGSLTLYLSDVIPIFLMAAALSVGVERSSATGWARLSLNAGVLFVVLLGIGFVRTASSRGLSDALQARQLLPLLLAVVLPSCRGFRNLPSLAVLRIISIAAIAIGVDSVIRLARGYATTSTLGVERIYQTWEPFIACCLLLILVAHCLVGANVRVLHYVGIGFAAIPIVFSFFRVAWVLTAVIVLLLYLFARGKTVNAWVLVGLATAAFVVVGIGALGTGNGPTYASQIVLRANEIQPHLDSYRSQEYGAVWDEIKQHPLAGSGFGTEYVGSWTTVRAWCHNAYEWIWWRLGLIGLAAFVCFIGGAAAAARGAARRLDGDNRSLALGLLAAFAFLLPAATFHENFENYQSNLVTALLVAQAIVLATRNADGSS
jgi:O-antigen ligase